MDLGVNASGVLAVDRNAPVNAQSFVYISANDAASNVLSVYKLNVNVSGPIVIQGPSAILGQAFNGDLRGLLQVYEEPFNGTYSLVNNPNSWLTLASNGIITGTAPFMVGNYSFHFTVTRTFAGVGVTLSEGDFEITVSDVPVISANLSVQAGLTDSLNLATLLPGGINTAGFTYQLDNSQFGYPDWLVLSGNVLTGSPSQHNTTWPFSVGVRVNDGNGNMVYLINVAVSMVPVPQVAGQSSLVAGGSLSLSLVGMYPSASFQWIRNGSAILSGGTAAQYNVGSVAAGTHDGLYYVQISTPGGTIRSESVAVTVADASVANRVIAARNILKTTTPTTLGVNADAVLAALGATGSDNGEAAFLRAYVKWGKLLGDSATKDAFTNIGFAEKALNDPFNLRWTKIPAVGSTSAAFKSWLLSSAYPVLDEINTLLATIPQTFAVSLTPEETAGQVADRLVVDYGDVQMLRAGAQNLMWFAKWLESQNTDVYMDSLKDVQNAGRLSFQTVLDLYPDLLTAGGTNAQTALNQSVTAIRGAATAFVNAANFIQPAAGVAGRVEREGHMFSIESEQDRSAFQLAIDDATQLRDSLNATTVATAQRNWNAHGTQVAGAPTTDGIGSQNVPFNALAIATHAPGWRADLPLFYHNAVEPLSLAGTSTLARTTIKSGLPTAPLGKTELILSRQEHGVNKTMGTINTPSQLNRLTILNGGSGYAVGTTLNFASSDGFGAAATPAITGGSITGYTLTNRGSGYTAAPKVSAVGTGAHAKITATLDRPVLLFNYSNVSTPVSAGSVQTAQLAPLVSGTLGLVTPLSFAPAPGSRLPAGEIVVSGTGTLTLHPTAGFIGGMKTFTVLVMDSSMVPRTLEGLVTVKAISAIPVVPASLAVATGSTQILDLDGLVGLSALTRPLSLGMIQGLPAWITVNGTQIVATPAALDPAPLTLVLSIPINDSAAVPVSRIVELSVSLTDGGAQGLRSTGLALDTIRVLDIAAGDTLTLAGVLQGAGGITKMGLGQLVLSGATNYSGLTSVGAGSVLMAGASSGASALAISGSGYVSYVSSQTITGLAGNGALALNNATLTVVQGTPSVFSGVISGNGSLVKSGVAVLVLSGTNNYTGGTVVSSGTLSLGRSNALAPAGAVSVGGGVLDLGGFTQNVGAVALTDGAIVNGTLVGSGYSMQRGTVTSVLAGQGGFTKSGSGTLLLTGSNTYAGVTRVQGGTLVVRPNALLLSGTVTVNLGAALVFDGLQSTLNLPNLTISGSGQVLSSNAAYAVIWKNGAVGGSLPTITAQPVGGAITFGGTIDLSVTASGGSLSYQWKKGGSNLLGQNQPTLHIEQAKLADSGNYSVVVSNPDSITLNKSPESNPVSVIVQSNPSIVQQPQPAVVALGSPFTLSVGVSGAPAAAISYQWFKDSVAITGATSANYGFAAFAATDDALYAVRVTVGSVVLLSNNVAVQLGTPVLQMTPISATTIPGGTLSFVVSHLNSTVVQGGSVTYEWSFNGVPLVQSGLTNAVLSTQTVVPSGGALGISQNPVLNMLTLSGVTVANRGAYDVKVSVDGFGFTTARGTLQVADVSIKAQPLSVQKKVGEVVTLSVQADGSNLSYQWRLNKGALTGSVTGGTSSTLTLPSLTAAQAGAYDVVVTSTVNGVATTASSQPATVSVFVPVAINNSLFQAQARTLDPGQRLSLDSFATGTAPLAYQWKKDGADISARNGGTQSVFVITSVKALPTDAGNYSVVVSQPGQTPVSSGTAAIVVNNPPTITSLRALVNGGTVNTGTLVSVPALATVVLSVQTDALDTTYQWRRNLIPLKDTATRPTKGSSFSFVVSSSDQEGSYDVVVSNTVGSATSTAVVVALSTPPVTVLSDVTDVTVVSGSLSVAKLSGFKASSATAYKWAFNGADISVASNGSANTDTLQIAGITAVNAGSYTVTASNSFSSVVSSARLIVLAPVVGAAIAGDLVANPGATMVFTATAAGGDLRYQWLLDGQAVQGANGPGYSLSADSIADAKAHKLAVRVYNQDGSGKVLSTDRKEVGLRVRVPVSITSLTQTSGAIAIGGTASFEVVSAGDTEKLGYQWFLNGGSISGARQAIYTVASATEAATGKYSVAVTNLVNVVASSSLDLVVKVPATITRDPIGRTVNSGRTVKLSVVARGTGVLGYQWYKGAALISGATGADYSLTVNTSGDEGAYSVVVTATNGSEVSTATSLPASILLNDTLTVGDISLDAPKVLVGSSVNFSVSAVVSGSATPRFQWRRNGKAISGAITQGTLTSSYQITSARVSDQGDYDVLVTLGGVSVASSPTHLDVFAPISVAVTPAGNTAALPATVALPTRDAVTLQAVVVSDAVSNLNYSWVKVGSPSVLSTGSLYTVIADDTLSKYRVTVTAMLSGLPDRTATSDAVPVQLLAPVTFSQSAESTVVVAGGAVTFTRVAQGGGTIQYQWERQRSGRWTSITGATSSVLALSGIRPSEEGLYRLGATNARSLVVGGVAQPTYSAELKLTVREVDVITAQPVSQAVNPGDAAVFEVKASGVDLAYQWRKNGVGIAGATSSKLTVSSAGGTASADKLDRDGAYDVQVTHAFGSSVSAVARLQVNEPVTIQLQPVDTSLVAGNPAKLFVVASGTPDLAYQWRKDGVALAGGTQSFYEINSASATDAGRYHVVVSNVVGKVVSSTAVVTVLAPVSIITSPSDVLGVLPGASVTFTVVATGSSPKYQWRKNGVALEEGTNSVTGTQTAMLTIPAADPGTDTDLGSAGRYDVVVSNAVNTLSSLPATLTVNAPPVILTQPTNVVVNKGDGARFSVTARGAGLTYQWFLVSGGSLVTAGSLNGATTAEYAITSVTDAQFASSYKVVVSNASGVVTSNTVTLTQFAGFSFGTGGPAEAPSTLAGSSVTVGTPLSGSIADGGTLTLNAPPITKNGFNVAYQWRKDGVEIFGATASSYVVNIARLAAGVYDVVVSALVDGAEKARIVSPATLLVLTGPPEIEAMYTHVAHPGQKVLFAPVVVSSGSVTYRWDKLVGGTFAQVVSVTESGSTAGVTVAPTNPLMEIRNLQYASAGTYQLSATDTNGTSASSVLLTVTPALVVNVTANGNVVPTGALKTNPRDRMVLDVTATGDGPFTYQWRFNGVNIVSATRTRFEVPSVLAVHAGLYDVVVTGASARLTSDPITMSLAVPLKIVTQPVSQVAVNQGQALNLSVEVNSSQGETYQWVKGQGRASQVIVGGTSSSLRISPVTAADAGSYLVIITGPTGQGRISSTAARVTVNLPVTITVPPVAQSVVPGQSVSFSVVVAGTPPFTYQWLRDGVRIPGAGSSTSQNSNAFQIGSVSINDAASYQVVVSNAVSTDGVVTPDAGALLSVSKPVTITAEPKDSVGLTAGNQVATAGVYPALLSVTADYDGIISYQWRRNGENLPEETASTLRPSKLTAYTSGQYDVVLRNTTSAGVEISRVVSRKATVQVNVPAAASGTTGEGLTANEGENVAFNSYAYTDQTTAWTWVLKTGTLAAGRVSGQGTSVLSLRNVTAADAGVYTATVSGGSSSSTVNWTLQVVPVPVITSQPVPLVGTLAVHPKTDAILSAAVTTTTDTRYQWYFQSTPTGASYSVPGATSSTLIVKNVSASDAGYYRLEVTNPAGTVSSNATQIYVFQPLTVSAGIYVGAQVSGGSLVSGTSSSGVVVGASTNGGTLLTSASVDPGSAVTFGAKITGDLVDSGAGAFQWYKLTTSKVWAVIPKAVQSTLTLTGVTEGNETYYRLRAFGVEGGAVDGAPVHLTVNDPVAFVGTLKTQALSVSQGETATLSVAVTGYRPQYQWLFNGTLVAAGTSGSVSGGTLLTYSIARAQPANGGTYSVIIQNGFTSPVTGTVANVTVKAAPSFASDAGATPSLVTGSTATTDATGIIRVDQGQSFTLTTLPAAGCVPFSYQWRRNGVPFVATGRQATGSVSIVSIPVTLAFTTSVAGDAGQYDVVITNQWGSVISNPVNVVVALKPTIVTQPKAVTANEGGSANFTVEVTGEAPLSYQWYFNGGSLSGGTSKLLSVSATTGRVSVPSTVGVYSVRVSNRLGSSDLSTAAQLTVTKPGDFTVSVGAKLGGLSVSSPVTASATGSFALSATVSGSASYSYQWRKNGVSIDSAKASSFSVPSLVNASGGAYDVVVSDGANFAYSPVVTVVIDPLIESLDVPSLVNPGDGLKLQVKAVSSKSLTYQWYKGQAAISGATSDVYTISLATAQDAGTYFVVVKATGGGSVTSDSRTLSVSGKVSITSQPVAQTVVAGNALSLAVGADNAATYQWYRTPLGGVRVAISNGGTISGATTQTLNIASVTSGDAGVYQVEVGNTAGSVFTVPAAVTVNASLSVSVTTRQVALVGSAVNLIATAVGSGTIRFAWYYTASGGSPVLIEGETTERLRINPVAIGDAGGYTVEVNNGSATASASATLSVLNVPEIVVAPASQAILAGGTVKFAVVAKFDKPLIYSWFRGSGGSRAPLISGDRTAASQLTLPNVTGTAFNTYTVRVADATNPDVSFVEVSATLSQKSGTEPVTISLATDYTRFWVYYVEAVADIPLNNRSGYWISERLKDVNTGVVTAGDSVWVWAPYTQVPSPVPDKWFAASAQVQEAQDNAREEYSVIANRTGSSAETYVISGRVESGAEAAVYGAPEQIDGQYEVEILLDVTLSWDSEVGITVGTAGNLADAATGAAAVLQSQKAVPAGE